MKILLVDDDPAIAQLVSHKLKKDNYIVEFASDGEYALDLLRASSYSLVLLDLMLPKLDGIEVCRTLRNRGIRTPVMMLTGQRHTGNKVCGLDAGADDYLVKPFDLDELAARMRALIRRDSEVASSVIVYGPLRFDPDTQILTYMEKSVSLRPKELSILKVMLRYPTRVFGPDCILDRLWNSADCPGRATVKAHIRSLRKRLAAAGADSVVETVYGRGYRLSQALLEDAYRIPQADGSQTQTDLEVEVTNSDGEKVAPTGDSRDSSNASNHKIIDETWQQVQSVSWHRLSRLQKLIDSQRSRHRELATDLPNRALSESSNHSLITVSQQQLSWKYVRKASITIAHQLKGTLGSFGFQDASLQAEQVEALLHLTHESSAGDDAEIALLQSQVDKMKRMVEQRMDAEPPEPTRSYALLACRDHNWAQTVQCLKQDTDLAIEICSPLEIDNHLLMQTPAVILVEISVAERMLDLNLLSALARNYSNQVPIMAVLNVAHLDEQQTAIRNGASIIALKSWSPKTLRAIVTEFI